MLSPVMNANFTNANINGKSAQVLILISPSTDAALYMAREKKGYELLFLHDTRVPANNSPCERLTRVFKRKQNQAITLRSHKNLRYI